MLLSVYRNTPLKFKVWVSAMTVSDLYTPNEVAIRLKVSPNTVRKWCRNFDIPSIKLGNQRRITGEVLRKIESGELMVGKVSSLSSPHIITKEKESQPPPIEEGVTPELPDDNWPTLRYSDPNIQEATTRQYSERLVRQMQYLNNPILPDE